MASHILLGGQLIKQKSINRYLALCKDTGDILINPIYNNLKLKDSINIFLQLKLRSSDHIFNENWVSKQAKSITQQRILAQSN